VIAWARVGRLITIEGVEGAGKSTQVARLGGWLVGLKVSVSVTAEPDGTSLGVGVRRLLGEHPALDPLTECVLFVAARAEHTRRVIRPALERGMTVISDRYADSTVAYQGYGRGVDLEVIASLNRLATDGLAPDLTLVLDLDVAEGLRRVRGRAAVPGAGADPFEGLESAFHERVRKGYRAIQEREPGRVALVDAMAPEDVVAGAIRAIVAGRFGLEGTRR
jgi:dTMP kinase